MTAVQVPSPLARLTPAVSLLQPRGLSVVGAALGRCRGFLSLPRPAGRLEPFLALMGARGGQRPPTRLVLLLVSTAAHPEWRLGAGCPQGLGSAWQDSGGPRAPNRQARGCGDRSGQAAMRGLPAGRLSGGGCSPQTLRLSAPEWVPLPLSTGPGLRLPEARLSAGLDGRVSIPEVGGLQFFPPGHPPRRSPAR